MAVALLRFDEPKVLQLLSSVPTQLRVVFAAACATRLLPAYLRFSRETGRGDPDWISKIANRLWDDLRGNEMSIDELQTAAERCEQLVPGEDQEPWVLAQAWADDAVGALAYALRCRKNGSEQEAAWAARRAYEAVDNFIINHESVKIDAKNGEELVLSHPLMQAELGRQQRDLEELRQGIHADQLKLTDRFRKRAITESEEFFGLAPSATTEAPRNKQS